MKTQCSGEQLEFHPLGRRSVSGRFDGGRISSDAGGVLLRELDKRTGVTARVARCFVDYRNPASVEHNVHELVSQRLYAIALGYEDLNDHGELRADALLSLLVRECKKSGAIRQRRGCGCHHPHKSATAPCFLVLPFFTIPSSCWHDKDRTLWSCPATACICFVKSHRVGTA